jgi:hypothetical protein
MGSASALHQLQRPIFHQCDQIGQPRLHARELDRPVLVVLPEADELAGVAAVFCGQVQAQVAPAAVVQEGHPAAPPIPWIVEVVPNHAVEHVLSTNEASPRTDEACFDP